MFAISLDLVRQKNILDFVAILTTSSKLWRYLRLVLLALLYPQQENKSGTNHWYDILKYKNNLRNHIPLSLRLLQLPLHEHFF